ncbi:hypothetical protein K6959_17685 [Bacillus aquiflavi]|uniref:hypothetical protein n=1 Tax=Bacillus aquiflavi TaxID=2672567 RepID=UPI001CA7F1F4|nr:hypothetical protein [Bacillus aquiflavi]UAC48326.1 hypothetical protein K6959_17685 [Bacillus aquiflavi]
MKKVKCTIGLILFVIAFSFIGESFIYYLDDFYHSFYSTTLYKPDYISDTEMKTDIISSMQNNEVEVFAVVEKLESNIDESISIYGTKKANEHLREELNMKEKKYESLLSGTVKIQFYDINEIPNMGKVTDYYLIGNKENIKAFKVELIDIYSGNHPVEGSKDNESKRNVVFIWLIILILILLFTYYDVLYQKKEALIKVTFGEEIRTLVFKNILVDTICFVGFFFGAGYFISMFTNSFFCFKYSLLLFCAFIVFNAVLYFSLYFYNLKEVFSNSRNSRTILTINYGLKIITIILSISIMSGNIALIIEGINFFRQKDFFETYKDYRYVQFDYKMTPDHETNSELIKKGAIVREEFYKENFQHSIQLVNITGNLDLTEPAILANKNAKDYIKSKIPEINKDINENKVYYILPKKYADDEAVLEKVQDVFNFFDHHHDANNYEVMIYEKNADLVSIDELNYVSRSKLLHNPIIILNHTGPEEIEISVETSLKKTTYAHDIMYLVTKEKFNSFVKKNNLSDQIYVNTNVFALYHYNWLIIKRGMIISTVLVSLVLVLELIIISLILRLEYDINAIELSIKKY